MSPISRVLMVAVFAILFGSIHACSGDSRPFEEAVEASQSGLASLSIRVPDGDLETVILNIGQRYTLELEGQNADNETFDVTGSNRRWVVADPAVASVDDNGTVTALNNGSTTVRVSIADVESYDFPITVSNFPLIAIQRLIGDTSLDPCVATNYRATGTFGDGSERTLAAVSFSATPDDSTTVTSLSENSASLVATTPGSIVLTATVGSLTRAETITVNDSLTEIAITPSPASVSVGSTLQMAASGTYTNADLVTTRDLTESLAWSISSEDERATISTASGSRGLVSGVAAGSASIAAACGDMSVLTTLTVSATGSSDSSLSFNRDGPLALTLRGGQFALKVSTGSTYTESNDVTSNTDFTIVGSATVVSIGNIGDAKGIINPLTIGSTRIRAVYDGQRVAEINVNVTAQ